MLLQKQVIAEIRQLHVEFVALSSDGIRKAFRIGELLYDQKSRVRHGDWLEWINKNLPFNRVTAANYMRLFEHKAALNVQGVVHLTEAYKLLSQPEKLAELEEELPESVDEVIPTAFKRNLEAENEMFEICTEVWQKIGIGKMPGIESKQGGSTAAFYPGSFKVIFRWNSWNKMPLAGKRLVAIHELYHALGRDHDSAQMFCHAYDMLTMEFYRLIYGEDEPFREAMEGIRQIAKSVIEEAQS